MKQHQLWVIAASVCISVSGWAGQQSAPAASPTASATAPVASATAPQLDAQAALNDRTTAYYTAVIGGNRAAAEQMISPDSRADFDQADFRTLAGFKIDQISLDASGEKADVVVTRTFRGAFGMNMPWHDHWVKTDGQWMLSFPKATHETPFGVMNPSTAPMDPQVMQRMADQQMRKVDPDQPMIQLQKYLKAHPDAVPEQTIMIPDPRASMQQQPVQPQTSAAQPQNDAKASSAAKPATTDGNAGKTKKNKHKKSKQPAGTTTSPQS